MNFLLVDIAAHQLSGEDKEILAHPAVAGVVLFTRNYDSPSQLRQLTRAIHDINADLQIMVDQEGGRVQRFREGFTALPSMGFWRKRFRQDPVNTLSDLEHCVATMVAELRQAGVDINLMPVLDIDYGANQVIADRSLGGTAGEVIELADAVLSSLKRCGMPSVGKHFPGHGAVTADSHHELPVDQRSLSEIMANDVLPYQVLHRKLDIVMTAHVVYPAVDELPATFSATWLRGILRQQLGFNGTIISDCLSMEAVRRFGDYPTCAELALRAGCDQVLACNNRQGVLAILDSSLGTCAK